MFVFVLYSTIATSFIYVQLISVFDMENDGFNNKLN